ncbi:MAG: hypothetical protein WC253_01540 [Sulfurovaceae bacterium]
MKKTVIIIISIIAMISLAKCGYDEYTYGDITPQINPHPTKKVRIHGKFPFDSDIRLEGIQAAYINVNPKCNKVAKSFGIIPAAEVKLYEDINLTVKRLSNNEYEAYYYQDYFLPGACEWKFDWFRITIASKYDTLTGAIRFGGFSEGLYGFAKYYKEEKYEFSNKLTYECHLDTLLRPNRKPQTSLVCDSKNAKNGKWISPYQDAMDVEQNFIYKKGRTIQWQQ